MRTAHAHLRLVEPELRVEAVDISDDEKVHSIHSIYPSRFLISPAIAEYIIKRFSKQGDVVVDPMCKSGTVPFASHLLQRVAYAAEQHPLWISIANAKLEPSDLANVALKTQLLPLRKPVSLEQYRKFFFPFFDPHTYCELVNLQSAIRSDRDKTARFVELLTISLLHGPSAGFLSAPTSAFGVGSPDHQEEQNRQRKISPDYRAVSPRLLKKAASALSDSVPSVPRKISMNHRIVLSDPRNCGSFASQSADLAITEVASKKLMPIQEQWLRCWFLGVSPHDQVSEAFDLSLDGWNQVLMELARVIKCGGRAVFVMNRAYDNEFIDAFTQMIQEDLSAFWGWEGEIQFPSHKIQVGSTRGTEQKIALVLRRKG